MTITQQGILTLLKSAVIGQRYPLPEGFSLAEAGELIRRHHIAPLVFQGAVTCGIPRSHPDMAPLFQAYCKALMVSEGQLRQLSRIYAAFDEAGIDYLPLKGCLMKHRYPKPELRTMADADILIRPEQYDRIKPIMEALGFTFQTESDHELIWHSPALHLELHKRLIPSYHRDMSPFFDRVWENAERQTGCRYRMKPEDEWIYLFTHYAKHYRDSGIGCRHVLDLWVYRQSCPGQDELAVRAELTRMGLREFYDNTMSLLASWIKGMPMTDITRVMTEYIFLSGSWGTGENSALSAALRSARGSSDASGRRRYLMAYLFPAREDMVRRHPVLKKAPFLLPVLWLVRLGYKVLLCPRELRRKSRDMAHMTPENVRLRREMLELVGLAYRL